MSGRGSQSSSVKKAHYWGSSISKGKEKQRENHASEEGKWLGPSWMVCCENVKWHLLGFQLWVAGCHLCSSTHKQKEVLLQTILRTWQKKRRNIRLERDPKDHLEWQLAQAVGQSVGSELTSSSSCCLLWSRFNVHFLRRKQNWKKKTWKCSHYCLGENIVHQSPYINKTQGVWD